MTRHVRLCLFLLAAVALTAAVSEPVHAQSGSGSLSGGYTQQGRAPKVYHVHSTVSGSWPVGYCGFQLDAQIIRLVPNQASLMVGTGMDAGTVWHQAAGSKTWDKADWTHNVLSPPTAVTGDEYALDWKVTLQPADANGQPAGAPWVKQDRAKHTLK